MTPTPALWRIGVKQMEERSGDGRNAAAWERWVAHALQFTLPSSCANSNHLWLCCRAWTPASWVANPRTPASLIFSDHFNMVTSSLASRKGTNVPVLILLCPLAGEYAVCHWAGTWEESPSCAARTGHTNQRHGNRCRQAGPCCD